MEFELVPEEVGLPAKQQYLCSCAPKGNNSINRQHSFKQPEFYFKKSKSMRLEKESWPNG